MDAAAHPTPAALALKDLEGDLFAEALSTPAADPSDTAPAASTMVAFTGVLTRNAELRNKPPRDGFHAVPVVCLELKNIQDHGPRHCHVDHAFTDATRGKAEALAKSLKKGAVITVMARESDMRMSISHTVSLQPHEAQAA